MSLGIGPVLAQQPSGEAMPVGDLPGWHQIYTDDFVGTSVAIGAFPDAVSTKWTAYPDGWKDTSKNGTYYPSKVVSIHDGVMDLYIHTENGVHLVAVPEPKLPGSSSSNGMKYGRYAVRFKSDALANYKTAWLLWPDSEVWPRDGEIDYPEGDLNGTMSAFMHRQNGTSGGDQDYYGSSARYTSWHTAIIEWSADRCNFILDGNSIGTSTNRIPNTSMHWVLQTETGLGGTAPADTTAGHVLIDWVAVWAPASTTVERPLHTGVNLKIPATPSAIYDLSGKLIGKSATGKISGFLRSRSFRQQGFVCVIVPLDCQVPRLSIIP
jgi:hypothetical protein